MKKWVVIIIASLFTNILSQTNVSPHFSELKGLEDQLGKNTLVSNEILNLYPLTISNRWIYLLRTVIDPNVYYDVRITEVLCDSVAANGKLSII